MSGSADSIEKSLIHLRQLICIQLPLESLRWGMLLFRSYHFRNLYYSIKKHFFLQAPPISVGRATETVVFIGCCISNCVTADHKFGQSKFPLCISLNKFASFLVVKVRCYKNKWGPLYCIKWPCYKYFTNLCSTALYIISLLVTDKTGDEKKVLFVWDPIWSFA